MYLQRLFVQRWRGSRGCLYIEFDAGGRECWAIEFDVERLDERDVDEHWPLPLDIGETDDIVLVVVKLWVRIELNVFDSVALKSEFV